MNNKDTIKALAYQRLAEADILCQNGKYDGAYYLLGYSVELMLKWRICRHFDIDNLFGEGKDGADSDHPGVGELRKVAKTHNIAVLLILSGLKVKLDGEKMLNPVLEKTIFLLLTQSDNPWNEQMRYKLHAKHESDVRTLITLLRDDRGLLKWIEMN